jgi:hypothetical protein
VSGTKLRLYKIVPDQLQRGFWHDERSTPELQELVNGSC